MRGSRSKSGSPHRARAGARPPNQGPFKPDPWVCDGCKKPQPERACRNLAKDGRTLCARCLAQAPDASRTHHPGAPCGAQLDAFSPHALASWWAGTGNLCVACGTCGASLKHGRR